MHLHQSQLFHLFGQLKLAWELLLIESLWLIGFLNHFLIKCYMSMEMDFWTGNCSIYFLSESIETLTTSKPLFLYFEYSALMFGSSFIQGLHHIA